MPPARAAKSLARFFWARVIGCLGVTAYVPGWPRGHSGEPGSFLPFVFLLVDVWFRVLLMMGSCPPGVSGSRCAWYSHSRP
jgi:hypothetical protein